MSDSEPEQKAPESKSEASATGTPEASPASAPAPTAAETPKTSSTGAPTPSAAGKPTRRAGVAAGSGRRAVGGEPKAPANTPPKPDTAKVIALAICGALALACLVVLVYIMVFKKKPPEKSAIDKLAPAARALAEKADRAAKLYEVGKAKAGSDKLEDVTEAEKNMFDALNLFNEVADEYKTVPGFEDKIKLAHDKKQSIDAELKKVRDKKFDLENQASRERREKAKTAEPGKTPDAAPATPPPTPAGKEPTDEELSDKNLDRLFTDDPSEYEKLAKIREKKDPTFKMKKP